MIDAMSILQAERDLMCSAEKAIRNALAQESPGLAMSLILDAYSRLPSTAEKHAFVAVLASRVSIANVPKCA
jgi:hypothetical protein